MHPSCFQTTAHGPVIERIVWENIVQMVAVLRRKFPGANEEEILLVNQSRLNFLRLSAQN